MNTLVLVDCILIMSDFLVQFIQTLMMSFKAFKTKPISNTIKIINNLNLNSVHMMTVMLCQRLIKAIFNTSFKPIHPHADSEKQKTKLLFYPGGLKNNGITTSMLNLLENIDYENTTSH